MTRFFFHVFDHAVAIDDDGLELADERAARAAAVAGAREMACEQIRTGHLRLDHRIEITDETGNLVATLPFRDAFTIEG